MRILILGGDGMLGHQLMVSLRPEHDVRVTVHKQLADYAHLGLFDADNAYAGVDVLFQDRLLEVMADFRPDAVINGVGLVKQRKEAEVRLPSLEVNALFPHRLAVICQVAGARLIHMSTDCVFSGGKGGYVEEDESDATDIYGRTKFLGEVNHAHCVTLRTSIIGLELARKASLIEWFLAQHGEIKGYRRAIYSGLTTLEMARVIDDILCHHPSLSGVWHVAAAPISKYEILRQLIGLLGRKDVDLLPDDGFVADRSLDATRFQQETGYNPPSWEVMLEQLAQQIEERNS
ncbi:MAG: SDR family oxidoreductase [Mariprofundales bacterium]